MNDSAHTWRIEDNQIVEKPWGREEIFAGEDGLYVGKIITILDGFSVSLQTHKRKTESLTVLRGELSAELGDTAETVERKTLRPGSGLFVPAGVIHRFTAVGDTTFVEVSTADTGWETDVTRLEDSFGRSGTSAQ
ncbi:MAG: cupin domain-containing protein [Leucobacter sp.]